MFIFFKCYTEIVEVYNMLNCIYMCKIKCSQYSVTPVLKNIFKVMPILEVFSLNLFIKIKTPLPKFDGFVWVFMFPWPSFQT